LTQTLNSPPTPSETSQNILDRWVWFFASKFGSKAKEVDRFLKFAIVGGFGAVVDFAVLNLLQLTVFPPSGGNESLHVALATGSAFTCAVISNLIWNRYWTFPDSRSRTVRKQLFQFFAVSIVGLIFRLFFVSATYGPFGDFAQGILNSSTDPEAMNQLGSNIAQSISILIILFWNFFANRYWTYNDID
jgi:putative flippase GtrA